MDFKFTQPSELRDFKEWHRGVEYYGFWAIEISDREILSNISNIQAKLASLLHPGYQRQPHIKILASGLMAEGLFSEAILDLQIQAIIDKNINEFQISISGINSFSTSPYLSVIEPFQVIKSIRQSLIDFQDEDCPSDYIPHITLGLYNDHYSQEKIERELSALSKQTLMATQTISSIIFARYLSSEIQGPYEVISRIHLSKTNTQ